MTNFLFVHVWPTEIVLTIYQKGKRLQLTQPHTVRYSDNSDWPRRWDWVADWIHFLNPRDVAVKIHVKGEHE